MNTVTMRQRISPSHSSHLFLEDSSKSLCLTSDSSGVYSMDEHFATLQLLKSDDFCNEEQNEDAILALPKRSNKYQRPLAIQLARQLHPEKSELSALIQYEELVTYAKANVRRKRKERLLCQLRPKNNLGGKLLRLQGAWPGQEIDPVDLKGPSAIPMPVEIGSITDFQPIFSFLAQNPALAETVVPQVNEVFNVNYSSELKWKTPCLEFKRGIIYNDGRLDLCKMVVGPTHIRSLMDSLESNNQISHFLLGNNAISTTGANSIANFIRNYPDRMETWYLAGCHITRHGLSLLAPEMIKSSKITNLWFKRNPFGPQSASILAELVLRTANLRTLDLETTELGDKGTSQFIDAITGYEAALRNLYLNANGIGENACSSLAKYLANPACSIKSLFLSTNPIGDAGIAQLVTGLKSNKSLKRLTLASSGITSTGVTILASALTTGNHQLQTLDLSVSQTTTVHGQRYNRLDDSCIEALKLFILSPTLRWLNLGRTAFSKDGLQEINSTVALSELVYFNAYPSSEEGNKSPLPCYLAVRKRLAKNQARYYPKVGSYDEFLNSEEIRFIRNTSDVRKIDSMYRTRNKRAGFEEEAVWKEGDETLKLIHEDAEAWLEKLELAGSQSGGKGNPLY